MRGQLDGVVSDIGDILRRRLTRRRGLASDPTFTPDPWTAVAAAWLRELYGQEDDRSVLPHARLAAQSTSQR
jgi:hypothetical protein